MADTTYTYSLSADFPGGAINASRLDSEIRASSIVTSLRGVSVRGDVVDITFAAALSAGEKTTLDNDTTAPAGGLIAAHDNATEIVEPKKSSKGVLLTQPQPQSPGLEMCDRDIKLSTCLKTNSFEDFKINPTTLKEDNWGEISLVDVYKDSGGSMVACTDQADADVNGILSIWNYKAIDQADGTTEIAYDLRGGTFYVDTAIAGGTFDHRIYAVAAPDIPAASGGAIKLFDGYFGHLGGKVIDALSPQAKSLDPAVATGANVLRVYLYHPAGSKLNHVLRLVTYRPTGTF